MSILEQKIVLRMNANWQVMDTITPKEAFVKMSREKLPSYSKGMKRPYNALHIEYPLIDGSIDLNGNVTMIPVEWKDWINLPIRPQDKFINSAKYQIRVPTVIIANNYNKIPVKKPNFSSSAVWLRDDWTCQITGDKVNKKTGSIEHLIPRSKGGPTSFENCYIARRDLNYLKADMSPEDFERKTGYALPKKLKTPIAELRRVGNKYNIKDWELFL